MIADNHSDWLGSTFTPNPDKVLLFCFPFAGGGSQFYTKWQKQVGQHVQVCPVFLPGRERRIREPLRDNMSALIDELADVISAYSHYKYALFGHSMGALISHLLTCKLIQRGYPGPIHLFVSARGYIPAEAMRSKLKELGFQGYLDSILDLSSQTELVLKNEALRKIFLPIFQADVGLCANWESEHLTQIPLPITAFYGDADDSVSLDSVKAWGAKTAAEFEMEVMPGEHLFVQQQAKLICQKITQTLSHCSMV